MAPTPVPHEPTMLDSGQSEAAAHLLARAFASDPFMVYAMPSSQRRSRVLPVLFRIIVRYCLRYGAIYATSNLDGVACCLPPGQTATIGRLALISVSAPPLQLGLTGLRRFLRVSTVAERAHTQAAPGAHWYLWALGVDPACQGRGRGCQLVRTVLRQARARDLPCYLDTENPRNVPFYQRLGFRLVSETMIPSSDVSISTMLWDPDADCRAAQR
jgi:acetyltransferase (GNAT) family protein